MVSRMVLAFFFFFYLFSFSFITINTTSTSSKQAYYTLLANLLFIVYISRTACEILFIFGSRYLDGITMDMDYLRVRPLGGARISN